MTTDRSSLFVSWKSTFSSLLVVSLFVANASASMQTFNFGSFDFSGDGSSTLPFFGSGGTLVSDAVVVTISDEAPGLSLGKEVRVSVAFKSGLPAGIGKLSHLWLNLVDDSIASMLTINDTDAFYKNNTFKSPLNNNVDGAGNFDVAIGFKTGGSNTLDPGETAMFDLLLNGPGTLTPASFLATSQRPSIPEKAFYAAIHMNQTGTGFDSGHYAGALANTEDSGGEHMPEPASIFVWLILATTLGYCHWRRRN